MHSLQSTLQACNSGGCQEAIFMKKNVMALTTFNWSFQYSKEQSHTVCREEWIPSVSLLLSLSKILGRIGFYMRCFTMQNNWRKNVSWVTVNVLTTTVLSVPLFIFFLTVTFVLQFSLVFCLCSWCVWWCFTLSISRWDPGCHSPCLCALYYSSWQVNED